MTLEGPQQPQAMRPSALVLILEDEPLLMLGLVDYVEQAGCEAIEVCDAAKAVAILERRTDVRMVITDLDVRGAVAGMRLAALIRDRWPPIHLLLTSSAPRPPPLGQMPLNSVYVGKPFDGPALVGTIRRFLAESS